MLRAVATKPTAVYTLAQSAVAVSAPSDTNEDTLATITIPGGLMGPNGSVRIWTLWTTTSSANNKTLRLRLDGIGGTQYLTLVQTAVVTTQMVTLISNRAATNSQVGHSAGAVSSVFGAGAGGAIATSSADMTTDRTIVITGQKALNTETLTLERYLVELMP